MEGQRTQDAVIHDRGLQSSPLSERLHVVVMFKERRIVIEEKAYLVFAICNQLVAAHFAQRVMVAAVRQAAL